MKCQICCRRKATTTGTDKHGTFQVCLACRREFFPNPLEQIEDSERAMRLAERESEFYAHQSLWG